MHAAKNPATPSLDPAALDGKRSPRGILVRPRQQFRYAFMLVAGGILAQSAVVAVMAYFINATASNVLASHNISPEVGQAISQSVNLACGFMMLMALAFALVAVLIGVKLSHRIYGTMVPFSRHIEQLRSGNYAARIRLRKRDDLYEMKDALNGLAATLEEKYSNPNARHG
jgi:hypothetical protein